MKSPAISNRRTSAETSLIRGNRTLMRAMNMKIVLDAIRHTDSLSQAQLVRQTHLSVGTIVRIVAVLKRRDLVREIGPGISSIGRKPTQLSFNALARRVIGAVLESDEATIAILDLNARILDQCTFSISPHRGTGVFADTFKRHMDQLMKQNNLPQSQIAGVGLSVQGLVDNRGENVLASKHLGWINAPLNKELRQRLKLPVYMGTEARTKVMAEHHWGAAKGVADVLLVEISTGLGVAMLIGGQLCRGHLGMAGELGQSIITNDATDQPLHLEDLASGKAMIQAANPSSGEAQPIDNTTMRRSLRTLFEAVRNGDKKMQKIVRDAAEHLGLAIATQVNVMDPARIILTGMVIDESGDLFVSVVRESVQRHVWRAEIRQLDIVASPLGHSSAIKGAAAMVYDVVFDVQGPLLS